LFVGGHAGTFQFRRSMAGRGKWRVGAGSGLESATERLEIVVTDLQKSPRNLNLLLAGVNGIAREDGNGAV
jgi:hypothetical protein